MVSQAYAREAAPVEVLTVTGKGQIARLVCAQCGAKQEWRFDRRPPPEACRKHFHVQGWNLSKKPLCPECAKPKEKVSMTANITPIKPAPEQSEAAKKVKRLIYMALEDYYDDAKKQYKSGHTDATIAKELGTSESFVKTIRESDFGPLAIPPEIAAIRAEITNAASLVGKLQTKLNDLCKNNGWQG